MAGPYPLPTLAVTINSAGITAPPFEDILASLTASYQQIYGSDTYLAPDSQDGQWIAIQAQAIYDSNQAAIATYLAYSPITSQGAGLSSVVKINGLQRLIPTNSSAGMRLIGRAGTIINRGLVIDEFGNNWALPPTVVIPLDGDITVTANCRTPGSIKAAPNTITLIATPVPGWQTATNPVSANPGLPVENDATLRRRQSRSTALPAITPIGGIYGSVANIPGVGRLTVYENDTDMVDEDMIPGHSIAVVSEGGDAEAIANAIALKKSPGCGTYGTTSVDVVDGAAMPNTINFFYLDYVPIWVTIRLRPLAGYIASTAELIRNSLVTFVNSLDIGEHVYRAWLTAPAALQGTAALDATGLNQLQLSGLAITYVVEDLLIGYGQTTVGTDDLLIPFNTAASLSAENVAIILV